MDREAIKKQREFKIIESNDIVRKAKYSLTATEQKALAFIISKIRKEDKELKTCVFSVRDFCRVCGIDPNQTKNRQRIKKSLVRLGTAGFWLEAGANKECYRTWADANTIAVDWKKDIAEIKLSNWLSEHLIGLKKNYTESVLISILPMQSEYSIRLFRLCRSYLYQDTFTIGLAELKNLLTDGEVEKFYPRFPDFRRKVLEIAEREINAFSEIAITWEPILKGNKVDAIRFSVSGNNDINRFMNCWNWEDRVDGIPGQMTLKDYIEPKVVDAAAD